MPGLKQIGAAAAALLDGLLRSERMPHCFLLSGATATARRDTAVYIAAAIECRAPTRPCGKCRDCRKAAENLHPDILYTEAGGKSATVRLDDVRMIRETSVLPPGEGAARVYIVPEADKLRPDGQNSLLKIIEEPPEHVYIILCADSRASLLPTVLSRLYEINLGAAQADISDKTRQKAAGVCSEAAAAICGGDAFALAAALKQLDKDRSGISLFAQQFRLVLRDAMMRGAEGLSGQSEDAARLAAACSPEQLYRMMQAAGFAADAAARNANINLLLTLLSARLAEAAGI